MANLSSLNNRISINSNVVSNPTAPNSVTLNSRRTTDDLNRISSYINTILVPAFNTLSSGERYPYDVSQHGLGGSTIPTYLESCGNNNKLSELYWKLSSEPGGGRPTTIKESFDYLNTRINYTLNLIQKPEISFPPEIGNLPEQVNNLFGYIKKMFFDLYSSPNETHDLVADINPTVPAYSTTSLIYQLYNQLFDVDLNGQGTPSNFYNLVDQSEKAGLTISLKNNLFVTELENLTDVNVIDKTDSQVLSWNQAQNKWIPVDKDSGPGYTGATYDPLTGQVTFNSDYHELQLTTGDLRGPAGADGIQGVDGQDALWNYRGEYGIGDSYAIGDVVTYDGRTWYRKDANGGNLGDTPSIGLYWDLLADKGSDGSVGQDALWNFRGAWDIQTTYEIGDVVQYNGSSYYKYAFNEDPNADDYPTNPITWQLVVSKGENGTSGSQGPQGEPGPQGPEGPTGSIKLLSDVRDFMTPNDGDALIWDNTNSEWYATKVALGISTSGDYVESLIAGTGISLTTNLSSPTVSLSSGVATAGTYKSVTVDTYGRVTAGTNPDSLAGYGITDAQPLDATLTELANLTTAANQTIYSTGPNTFAMTNLSVFGRSLIDDADNVAARSTLGLVIGADVQAYDADLNAIAALPGTSGYLKKTAANTWSLDTSTFVDTTTNQTIGGTKTFSNTINANISGNSSTATQLATARTIALSGAVSGSASFDGSSPITISTSSNITFPVSWITYSQQSTVTILAGTKDISNPNLTNVFIEGTLSKDFANEIALHPHLIWRNNTGHTIKITYIDLVVFSGGSTDGGTTDYKFDLVKCINDQAALVQNTWTSQSSTISVLRSTNENFKNHRPLPGSLDTSVNPISILNGEWFGIRTLTHPYHHGYGLAGTITAFVVE